MQAMFSVRNRKEQGLNGISVELIKYEGMLLHLRSLGFFDMVWKGNFIPEGLKLGKVNLI